MLLERLEIPIVLAPMAGGPSTPELAAAVSGAGGLGFLAAGYLSAGQLDERLEALRAMTDRPFGVNVFVPGDGPTDAGAYAAYLERLREWAARAGAELGEPRYSDDEWEAKLELLAARPPAVVSFTFGCPAAEVVARLQAAGAEVWVTVTTPAEARQAEAAGVDALVLQGAEGGGHRGSFADRPDLPVYGVLALLTLVREATALPCLASGGIATGAAVAAVLCAGAEAAQVGTAFMLAPEAGTAPAHREALQGPGETGLTRAFSGRLARGIRNQFMVEHDAAAPLAYPEIHYVTAPVRREARERSDPERINLWAGEAHALARELPAAEIARGLADDARRALESAAVTRLRG